MPHYSKHTRSERQIKMNISLLKILSKVSVLTFLGFCVFTAFNYGDAALKTRMATQSAQAVPVPQCETKCSMVIAPVSIEKPSSKDQASDFAIKLAETESGKIEAINENEIDYN